MTAAKNYYAMTPDELRQLPIAEQSKAYFLFSTNETWNFMPSREKGWPSTGELLEIMDFDDRRDRRTRKGAAS